MMKGARGKTNQSGVGRLFRPAALLPVLCCLAVGFHRLAEWGNAEDLRCVWDDTTPLKVLPCVGEFIPGDTFYVRCPRMSHIKACLQPISNLSSECPIDQGPERIVKLLPHRVDLPTEGDESWPIHVTTNQEAPESDVTVYVVCTPVDGLSGWIGRLTYKGKDWNGGTPPTTTPPTTTPPTTTPPTTTPPNSPSKPSSSSKDPATPNNTDHSESTSSASSICVPTAWALVSIASVAAAASI